MFRLDGPGRDGPGRAAAGEWKRGRRWRGILYEAFLQLLEFRIFHHARGVEAGAEVGRGEGETCREVNPLACIYYYIYYNRGRLCIIAAVDLYIYCIMLNLHTCY